MENARMLSIQRFLDNSDEKKFCALFLGARKNRYVFGCNEWAKSIAKLIDLDGFVDDFTEKAYFCGKPVIRSYELPKTALVISAIVGERPLTAKRRIIEQGVLCIDYYAFQKYSGLNLKDVFFLDEFEEEFRVNRVRYEWVHGRLKDDESQRILQRLLNFRLFRDLRFMEGFVDAQDRQYFEPFLGLSEGETFLDVGSFDGYTSQEFIKRCPAYKSIHVFEPDPTNMVKVKDRLDEERNIHFHPYGVSDQAQELYFTSSGSASFVCNTGDLSIKVERIDDVIDEPYSFLKMDIEGGEIPALQGASKTIAEFCPKMAISVYHKVDDLWKIPELVLSFHDDYDLYLRHYTEGVSETVMFFVPRHRTVE